MWLDWSNVLGAGIKWGGVVRFWNSEGIVVFIRGGEGLGVGGFKGFFG